MGTMGTNVSRVEPTAVLQKTGVLDGLQLFAALTVLSRGSLCERAALLFSVFDVRQNGFLERCSLEYLIERTVTGLIRSCTYSELTADENVFRDVVKRAFDEYVAEKDMSRREFDAWWQRGGIVRVTLRKFA